MDKHTEFRILTNGNLAMYSDNQEVALEIANGFLSDPNINEVKVIRSEVIWETVKNVGGK